MGDNLQIPYGIADFKRIRREGYRYIDKTGYIPLLEQAGSFLFFVRPRRFGKSLMASMLRCYYDVAEKDNFEWLFGGLEIARNPTGNANRFQVLDMDFSEVNRGDAAQPLQNRFVSYVGRCLDEFMARYGNCYGERFVEDFRKATAADKFTMVARRARTKGFPLYLILDEYDNFTNAMLRADGGEPYRGVTHGSGFYREWFKIFKSSFDRIYMTGVSPVTMDDLTSGFNIAANISQDERFNAMLGFSEEEVLELYTDFRGVGAYTRGEPAEWVRSFKPWYDGYCFSPKKVGKESVFNSDMVLYHLSALVDSGEPPENMVDRNIKTDEEIALLVNCERFLTKIYSPKMLTVDSVFKTVLEEGDIQISVLDQFDFEAIDDQETFLSLFYYYGVLTLKRYHQGLYYYGFPNEWERRRANRIVEAAHPDGSQAAKANTKQT